MLKSVERACAHSMLICSAFILVGVFIVPGWLLVPAASMTAAEVAAMFEAKRTAIRAGMTLLGCGAMFYLFFAGTISSQIERMSPGHLLLSRIQMVMAFGTAFAVMLLTFLGLALSFRDTLEPSTLQFGFDLWWLLFAGLWMPGVGQNIAIAVATLTDPHPEAEAIYPRWVAYVNIWVALSFAPGLYIAFFTTGPFAWHGPFGLYLVAAGFFVWAVVMWSTTLNAIRRA